MSEDRLIGYTVFFDKEKGTMIFCKMSSFDLTKNIFNPEFKLTATIENKRSVTHFNKKLSKKTILSGLKECIEKYE